MTQQPKTRVKVIGEPNEHTDDMVKQLQNWKCSDLDGRELNCIKVTPSKSTLIFVFKEKKK